MNLPRTTEVIEEIYPFDHTEFELYCDENGLDPDEILEFSSNFGTEIHKWCLEGVRPKEITDLHLAAYKQWLAAIKKYKIQLIETETPLVLFQDGKAICTGIRDAIALMEAPEEKISGIIQLDLKFYSCWRGLKEPYKAPAPAKLKKANLQTYNYNVAGNNESMPRAVLHLMANGFGLYPFKRRPLSGYKKFVAICQKRHSDTTF